MSARLPAIGWNSLTLFAAAVVASLLVGLKIYFRTELPSTSRSSTIGTKIKVAAAQISQTNGFEEPSGAIHPEEAAILNEWLGLIATEKMDRGLVGSLADRTVEKLHCSPALLRLIESISRLTKVPGDNHVAAELALCSAAETFIWKMTTLGNKAVMHKALLASATLEHDKNSLRKRIVSGWFAVAGRHASAADYHALMSGLESRFYEVALSSEYSVKLAASNPDQAILLIQEQLLQGGSSKYYDSAARVSFTMQALPLNSDFNNIAENWPSIAGLGETKESAINEGTQGLMKRWAERDAYEAASYIANHPERYEPRLMEEIITSAVQTKRESLSTYDWIKRFPKGPYYDVAAATCSKFLAMGSHELGVKGHAKEALELAAAIGDPALRQKTLDMARAYLDLDE